MLLPNTVFVIGAGVSAEFGLPLGGQLLHKIRAILPGEGGKGDEYVRAFLLNGRVNQYMAASNRIRAAIPFAASIDNLVEHLRGDDAAVTCAKVGIAAAIIGSERSSPLTMRRDGRGYSGNVDGTSFQQIFQLIVGSVHNQDLSEAFSRVSFINFNYDRCLEQFLHRALQAYSGLGSGRAAELVRYVNIKHPYGWLGMPDWMDSSGCAYGEVLDRIYIDRLCSGIRTFSEEVDSKNNEEIKIIMGAAERIIFLGCAPHNQNLNLIKPSKAKFSQIYGTVYVPAPVDPMGLAAPDMATFSRPISEALAVRLSSWERVEGSDLYESDLHFDPLTSRQLITRYGAEWLDIGTA